MNLEERIKADLERDPDTVDRDTIIQASEVTDLIIDMETLSSEELLLKYFCI